MDTIEKEMKWDAQVLSTNKQDLIVERITQRITQLITQRITQRITQISCINVSPQHSTH